jgi:hypothetical protein
VGFEPTERNVQQFSKSGILTIGRYPYINLEEGRGVDPLTIQHRHSSMAEDRGIEPPTLITLATISSRVIHHWMLSSIVSYLIHLNLSNTKPLIDMEILSI